MHPAASFTDFFLCRDEGIHVGAGTRVPDSENLNLVSADLDKVPMAYKDIEEVMAAQADLVSNVVRFDPRLARMIWGK